MNSCFEGAFKQYRSCKSSRILAHCIYLPLSYGIGGFGNTGYWRGANTGNARKLNCSLSCAIRGKTRAKKGLILYYFTLFKKDARKLAIQHSLFQNITPHCLAPVDPSTDVWFLQLETLWLCCNAGLELLTTLFFSSIFNVRAVTNAFSIFCIYYDARETLIINLILNLISILVLVEILTLLILIKYLRRSELLVVFHVEDVSPVKTFNHMIRFILCLNRQPISAIYHKFCSFLLPR